MAVLVMIVTDVRLMSISIVSLRHALAFFDKAFSVLRWYGSVCDTTVGGVEVVVI